MKIGFLIQNLSSGGAERAASAIASEMAAKGETVEIITFDSSLNFYKVGDGVRLVDMRLTDIEKRSSLKRAAECIKRAFVIRRQIKARKLDALICMSTTMNLYGLFSTVFTKTSVIGTERNNPYRYRADALNAMLKKCSSRRMDGFVFQTNAAAAYYPKRARKKGCVIRNAVFNPLVYEITPPEQKQDVICAVGRLSAQKRFDLLIRAFAQLHPAFPSFRLVIFGEGEDRASLQAQIDALGLQDHAVLAGNDTEALRTVAESRLFVLSSDYEGMPNALMEAMAVGTPCVSTRCKMGPEELITDGENGLLVPAGDADALAQAMKRVLGDPALAQTLSQNGRRLLETNNISAITDQWINYIKEL